MTAYANTVLLTEPASNIVFASTGSLEPLRFTPKPSCPGDATVADQRDRQARDVGGRQQARDLRFQIRNQRCGNVHSRLARGIGWS